MVGSKRPNKPIQVSKKAAAIAVSAIVSISMVLMLAMPPLSKAVADDAQAAQAASTQEQAAGQGSHASAKNSSSTTSTDDGNDGNVSNASKAHGKASTKDANCADSDDSNDSNDVTDGENVIAPASVDAQGYTEVNGNVADAFNNGGTFRLTDAAWSDSQITISQNTTIDLAGYMLYHGSGSAESFFVVKNGATLTIEDSGKTVDSKSAADNKPGQLATIEWGGGNNGTPQSLTYYEAVSTPNDDGLGTTETTTKHVVTGFGAIDAASDKGSVKHVVYVEAGGTLDLKGGMITTPRTLRTDGHVIAAAGTVNIEGGYVAGGNGGGWGGGVCATGQSASLNMAGGVIAANMAASGGGVFANNEATLNLSGGLVSGNATYGNVYNNGTNPNEGYGGGIFTKGASVNISGTANITNNRVDSYLNNGSLYNAGLLGGGGIASVTGGTLKMTGGSVTSNYSHEAGGGIYAGFWNQSIAFGMSGGIIAGNEAEYAEGGGIRIAGGTTGVIVAGEFNKVYITNNKTMTGQKRGGDWGGGGVFVQASAKLNIRKSLITDNEAGGWGGGIGACPTGQTIVTHTKGAAVYDNTDNGQNFSAGGHGKNEDSNGDYVTDAFKTSGHKDFFLVRNKNGANSTIAVVFGKMLGNGSAGWRGTCDGKKVEVDPNSGVEAKYMFGLEAHPSKDAKTNAQNAATTVISGNYSYTHGGGIMTNGDLIVGEVESISVYPGIKVNATKVLKKDNQTQTLSGHSYKFKLLRQTGTNAPSWKDDDTFDNGDCDVAGTATMDANGNIAFDAGADYSSGDYVFYLVEEPVSGVAEKDTVFDKTIYRVDATVDSKAYKTESLMGIDINYYKVNSATVSAKAKGATDFTKLDSSKYSYSNSSDNTTATVKIGNDSNPTFTNKIEPYVSKGEWMPKVSKTVKGGDMKKFTFEFAENESFLGAKTVSTATDAEKTQTLTFPDKIEYDLNDLDKGSDATGRGSKKTFTYYVREQTNLLTVFSHYKYDNSVYKFTVVAEDDTNKNITCTVTYAKIKDADGNDIPADKQETKRYVTTGADLSVPTFTNTYSTSLPNAGNPGITMTYLAGIAALIFAATWMHARRSSTAKGGDRRE